VPLVKILQANHEILEATRELEQEMRSKYPQFFDRLGACEVSPGKTVFKGVERENPKNYFIYLGLVFLFIITMNSTDLERLSS